MNENDFNQHLQSCNLLWTKNVASSFITVSNYLALVDDPEFNVSVLIKSWSRYATQYAAYIDDLQTQKESQPLTTPQQKRYLDGIDLCKTNHLHLFFQAQRVASTFAVELPQKPKP